MTRVFDLCDQSLAFLSRHRLAPTPQNYALGFALHEGALVELVRAVATITDGGIRLTQAEADALHEQFFGRAAAASGAGEPRSSTDAIRHQTLRLADLTASASTATGEFSRELAWRLPDIATADVSGLQDLVGATLERSRRTERELAATTAEVEQLRQKLETVQGDAERDALTGLANRRGIDAFLASACAGDEAMTLAICDVDRFKTYNDRYGHAVGDRVLRTVATSLGKTLAGHFVGRWGGEEFIVVARGSLEDGVALVEQAKNALGDTFFKLRETDEPMGRITFSAGVVVLPRDGAALPGALEHADALLYRAKEAGRDCVIGG